MIKAIIFDIDGVLVDSKNANVALFQTILSKAGYPTPSRSAVLRHFHQPLWQALEKLTGSTDQDEIRRIWELAKDPAMRNPDLFEFPDRLEDTLEQIHKRYKLAIVTSRIQAGVDEIFNARQIKHLFDVVVTFEDYENPKPHPEPLLVALKRLNIQTEEAIYVGDSHSDIDAATAAGMKSIHLAIEKHDDASAGIAHFDEIVGAIEQIA
ncbi:MAG TPA: HAD family hydrolase [Candidatus Saccharimonadia bacterium]|nr:HAD family hydrolase [Candidatus Saccharimonadia bacterium]